MEQLTADKKAVILVSLRNGEGFSIACCNAGLSPEEVSSYIQKYPSFMDECNDYLSAGLADLITQRQTHLKTHDYDTVKKLDEIRSRFIDKLVLWKSAGKSIYGFNPDVAMQIYKRPQEIATAYGLSYEAYLSYLKRSGK